MFKWPVANLPRNEQPIGALVLAAATWSPSWQKQ